MYYVIFDLEWNNAYNYKLGRGMNEIIEIGAVKLDERLTVTDTFKQLIKPKLSSKLSSRFKNLTHITMDEILQNGIPFERAISDFARWSSGADSIFMSWSNSDLYVLTDNCKKFLGSAYVDFIKRYADLQKFCQSFIETADSNQISLSHCAAAFDIDLSEENLHRALEDCYLAAECLRCVYDKSRLSEYIIECDAAFFERLVFKPYYLTKTITDEFNVYEQELRCLFCNSKLRVLTDYESINKSFRVVCECKKCKRKFWAFIRARVTYDGVVVTKKINIMNSKRARSVEKTEKI